MFMVTDYICIAFTIYSTSWHEFFRLDKVSGHFSWRNTVPCFIRSTFHLISSWICLNCKSLRRFTKRNETSLLSGSLQFYWKDEIKIWKYEKHKNIIKIWREVRKFMKKVANEQKAQHFNRKEHTREKSESKSTKGSKM